MCLKGKSIQGGGSMADEKVYPITVDGVLLPNPSSYDVQYADLDSENSYTSETGVLVRDMIRSNQRTVSVSWDIVSNSQLQAILQAISGRDSFQLKYWDFFDDDYRTGKFYADNRKTSAIRLKKVRGRLTLSTSLIEF